MRRAIRKVATASLLHDRCSDLRAARLLGCATIKPRDRPWLDQLDAQRHGVSATKAERREPGTLAARLEGVEQRREHTRTA